MPERRVIVNADDYGLAPGVSAGILEAVAVGVVTSISVMVTAPGLEEQLHWLRGMPRRPSVGLHLDLTAGAPVAGPRAVPTLVDPLGRFHALPRLVTLALTGRVTPADVEREMTAQLERLAAAGLPVTHVDGHRHVHALPGIWPVVRRVAERAGIRWVRRPVEPAFAGRPGALKRLALAASWRAAARAGAGADAAQLRGIGLDGARGFAGHFLAMMDDLPPGLTEVVVHPGHADQRAALLDGYVVEREGELAALLAPETRLRLRGGDITLTDFRAA